MSPHPTRLRSRSAKRLREWYPHLAQFVEQYRSRDCERPSQAWNQGFLNYVRVGSNLRVQAAAAVAGAPTFRTPEVEKDAVPEISNGTLEEQVMDTLYGLFPGHRAPTGIGQHPNG